MSLKVELLVESFDAVVPQKDVFAKTFYDNLFHAYPQTRLLFQHVNMKQQEGSLVAALALVISSLKTSDIDKLTSVLQALGQRHEGYGIERTHYWMVGNVLLRTFAELFGTQWTAELNDAWAEAYQTVVALMSSSIRERAVA